MRVLKSKVEKIKPTVAGDHAIDVDVNNNTNSIVVVIVVAVVVVVIVATDNNRALVQQRDPAYLTMRLRRI